MTDDGRRDAEGPGSTPTIIGGGGAIYGLPHLVATGAVCLLVGWISGTYLTRGESGVSPTRLPPPAVSPAEPGLDAAVQRVAAQFLCPCGQCGPDRLDLCDCNMPKGAAEVMGVIRDALRAGKPEAEVVALVETRYGHRIGAPGVPNPVPGAS